MLLLNRLTKTLALVVLLALVASACSWEKAETATPDSLPFIDTTTAAPTATITPSTTIMAPTGCVGRDFSINYPDTWYSASRSTYEECFWFSSAPIGDTSADSFPADFVPEITVITERRYEDALARVAQFNGTGYALVDSNAITVNGHAGTSFDVVSEGAADTPDGMRSRFVVVDIDGEALTLRATEATVAVGGPDVAYDETLNALDMMLNSLILPR